MIQVVMCCSLSSPSCLARLRCASDLTAPRTQCTHSCSKRCASVRVPEPPADWEAWVEVAVELFLLVQQLPLSLDHNPVCLPCTYTRATVYLYTSNSLFFIINQIFVKRLQSIRQRIIPHRICTRHFHFCYPFQAHHWRTTLEGFNRAYRCHKTLSLPVKMRISASIIAHLRWRHHQVQDVQTVFQS